MPNELSVSNPWEMLVKEQEKGTSVQDLKALMDLWERWTEKQAEQSWNRAMTNCQKTMPGLVKSSHNKHKDLWYAGFEQLDKQIRPIYVAEGFSLCFTEMDNPNPEVCRIALDVLHVDGHCRRFVKDVHIDGVGTGGNRSMTATQADGSTMSYARRYVTKMAFNLVDSNEDLDGDAGNNGRITLDEIKLLGAAIAELAALRGKKVDVAAFLKWLGPEIRSINEVNREQFLRGMSEISLQRNELQQKGK